MYKRQPYEYYDGDKIVGIDVDIAQAIADELGMTLEIEDVAFDSIIPEIVSGKADMALAGMTVTEDRKACLLYTSNEFRQHADVLFSDQSGHSAAWQAPALNAGSVQFFEY